MIQIGKQPQYLYIPPFRFVKPYEHTYETHCKKRWIGKQLFLVLTKQFKAYDAQYFLDAIKSGRILINNQPVAPTYLLRDNDLLKHNALREQPPILHLPIKLIHEDDDIVVVEKPPSIIVHTGGGYHYNTLENIMKAQMGYKQLYIVHRLDRLTSGILILAKKKEVATQFHQENAHEVMKKMYYARVGGQIPWEQHQISKPIICISHKDGVYAVYDPNHHQLPNNHPTGHPNHQQPPKDAKESTTIFKKIWYDQQSDTSLLECYPITGRTHQIRVHLSYLGYPILNDLVYGGKFVGNKTIEKMLQSQEKKQEKQEKQDKQDKDEDQEQNGVKRQRCYKQEQIRSKKVKLNSGYEADVKFPIERWDYQTKPWEIYLHSAKYFFQGKEYLASSPFWINKPI